MEIIRPEDMQQPSIRKAKQTPTIPPMAQMSQPIQEEVVKALENIKHQVNTTDTETLAKLDYSVKYEPLCGNKIPGIPKVLHYKPINGFFVSKLNELNIETIDTGLHEVLDALCYQSKYEGFSHWSMTVDEKIRAFLNLRLNSVGRSIEHLFGICKSCGKEKFFTKVDITKFDETDIKPEYVEPFPLKVKISGKEIKFKSRILRSGDVYKAKQIYEKDKEFISKKFPEIKEDDAKIVIQIIEYANSIIEIEGVPANLDTAVDFCKNNIQVMNAMTSMNDYFHYGMTLECNDICDNKNCPTSVKLETKSIKPNQEKEDTAFSGATFRLSVQPGLFYITYTEEEAVKQYFDL